jgi:hypothetical protein
MSEGTRRFWLVMGGFNLGGLVSHFLPPIEGRWPFALIGALIFFGGALVWPWLTTRYRIRIERKEG